MRGRLVREPLLHFVVAGMALFGAYRWLHPEPVGGDAERRIVVTEDDLRQMSLTWLAQGRPPPSPEQMRNLVERWVRDEVLYREALALGLDQGDTIVKRRLVQKMAFLSDDLADLREPTRAELEAWFAERADRFALAPRASFRQLYFSPDRRGEQARAGAEAALAKLAHGSVGAEQAASLADPFVLQLYYPDRTPDQIAKDFGPGFAEALLRLEPGAWRGPVESGFGWHLVFVESLAPARVPDFAEVAAAVEAAWVEEHRDAFARRAYETMRARYEVVLPAALTPRPLVAAGDTTE